MKNLPIIILLMFGLTAYSQQIQKINQRVVYPTIGGEKGLIIPKDTVLGPFDSAYSYISVKGGIARYFDSSIAKRWQTISAGGPDTLVMATRARVKHVADSLSAIARVDTIYQNGLDLLFKIKGNTYTLPNAFANISNADLDFTGDRFLYGNGYRWYNSGYSEFDLQTENEDGITSGNFGMGDNSFLFADRYDNTSPGTLGYYAHVGIEAKTTGDGKSYSDLFSVRNSSASAANRVGTHIRSFADTVVIEALTGESIRRALSLKFHGLPSTTSSAYYNLVIDTTTGIVYKKVQGSSGGGGGTTTPSLQAVTDVNDTTTRTITAAGIRAINGRMQLNGSSLIFSDASNNVLSMMTAGLVQGMNYIMPGIDPAIVGSQANGNVVYSNLNDNRLYTKDGAGNAHKLAYSSEITGGTVDTSNFVTLDGVQTVSNKTFTNPVISTKVDINNNGLGATTGTSILLVNNTASTSSVQQFSPSLNWRANYWNIGAAVSRPIEYRSFVDAVAGSSTFGNWKLQRSENNGSWLDVISASHGGNITASVFQGAMQTGSSGTSNFQAIAGSTTSSFAYPLGGATNTNVRIYTGGGSTATITANNSYATQFMGAASVTEPGSGTIPLLANLAIRPLNVTAGGAAVTNAPTVYIEGASNAVTTGGNYALWVDDGETRLDGQLTMNAPLVLHNSPTAPSAPQNGMMYYKSPDNTFQDYVGGAWKKRLHEGDVTPTYYANATLSADGTTTTYSFAHGRATNPGYVFVTPKTANSVASPYYVTTDASNIYINYTSPPPAGTSNLKFDAIVVIP